MSDNKTEVLQKGTIVKVDGLPFELAEDCPVFGQREGEAAQDSLAENGHQE